MKSDSPLLRTGLLSAAIIVAFFAGRQGYDQPANDVLTVYYPVQDLITPWAGADGSDELDYDTLVTMIRTVVEPGSWHDPRSLVPLPENRLLAVTHTRAVHQQIAELLRQCREPQFRYYDAVARGMGNDPTQRLASGATDSVA